MNLRGKGAMYKKTRQSGMSIPGMIVIAIMVGFFVMCAIRLGPGYFEYLSVKEIVNKVADNYDPREENITDIKRRLANLFNTNQIYALDPRDVEVYRKDGKTYIDARYELRVPIIGRIDAVWNFDDLEVVAGRKIVD